MADRVDRIRTSAAALCELLRGGTGDLSPELSTAIAQVESALADLAEPEEELTTMLRKSIDFGGVIYDRIITREPMAGQILEWSGLTGTAVDIKAVSVVSGLPEPVVRQIGSRDFNKAAAHISRFL